MRVTYAAGIGRAVTLTSAMGLLACAPEPREQGGTTTVNATEPARPPANATSAPDTSAPVNLLGQLAEGTVVPSGSSDVAGLVEPVPGPMAESAALERGPRTALGAAAGSAQVRYDGTPSLQSLPAVSTEVARARIGWYVNRSIDAFRSAIDQNKPLVLVVGVDWCEYCARLVYNALRCPATERMAGDAVFAYSYISLDKGASAIAGSLKIGAYPTITILEPESRILLERGRINGYFVASLFGTHLETVLWKTPPRVLPPSFELNAAASGSGQRSILGSWPSPQSSSSVGTERDAILETQRRGLRHAPPAPQCR